MSNSKLVLSRKVVLGRLLTMNTMAFHAVTQTLAQWRGLHRDGRYESANLLKSWPETGPTLLWFTEEIGNGYGAPAITDDRIYVNGETDSVSYLFALDAATGELLWSYKVLDAKDDAQRSNTQVDSVKVRNGSILYADGLFVCYGNNGEVNLVNAVQGKLTVTGKLKIEKGSKDHFAHPVLADGVLYIRRGKGLMAYKVN